MVDVQTISIVVAAVGVLIAAINSVYSSREANKQRQMQLLNEIYNNVLSREFRRDYEFIVRSKKIKWDNLDDWEIKYNIDSNPEVHLALMNVWTVLAYVCEVVNKGLVDLDLFDDIVRYLIIRFWEQYRSIILESRLRSDPMLAYDIELVYNRIIKKRQRLIAQPQIN